MKVLLYTENEKLNRKSGLGKAIEHQKQSLEYENIEYTTNLKDDYDILLINTWFIKSYFVAKKAKKQGKKIIYYAHSTEEDYKNSFLFSNQTSKIIKWWLIKCYSLGDVILTPTPYSKNLLKKYKGLENKKIYSLSNGIDSNYFKKDARMGKHFREVYNIKKDEKVIIGIGLYIERKGIIDFVELAKRMPEYKFIWFGYSPLIASPRKVRKAVKTKLPNLTFAGYVEKDMIKSALSGCDLYLFPTKEETEGIPIVEACSCKTPALIRDIPVFNEWLEEGINVYKAKDIEEFEKKIKDILNKKVKDLTKEAHKVAEERDQRNISKKLKEIIYSIK